MKNYKKYGFATLETENFIAYCNIYDNRSGFVHECRLEPKKTIQLKNGAFLSATTAKCQYYNRTWESYEFQSVILKACDELPKKEKELAKAEFENYGQQKNKELKTQLETFKTNYDSLTEGQKNALKGVTVESEEQMSGVCALVNMMSVFNKMGG